MAALIASRHLGRGVADLFLYMVFVDLDRGEEARAQGMPGEEEAALRLWQFEPQPGDEGACCTSPRHVAVVQAAVKRALIAAVSASSAKVISLGLCKGPVVRRITFTGPIGSQCSKAPSGSG
ncbi:hypothetical protein [Palleronia sp.]|uniref:hypothetical protein n=1 Tax=Palleronia sp. TaxID=1940284 RepID=UPI0035C86EAA